MEVHRSCEPRLANLREWLQKAAEMAPSAGVIAYPKQSQSPPVRLYYKDLYALSQQHSAALKSADGFYPGKCFLLYFEDHFNAIVWLWSVLLAGGLAVVAPRFSVSREHRTTHLRHLCALLDSPLCITAPELACAFEVCPGLRILTTDLLTKQQRSASGHTNANPAQQGGAHEPALLMLTSGSTGRPKAVPLSPYQLLASVKGKAGVRELPTKRAFLNWIGLDHAAGLVEIHLLAMYLAVDQVHVHAVDLDQSPRLFLDLLHRHAISRTFAPNFFLAKLVSTINGTQSKPRPDEWNLRQLVFLGSGGEPNDTETCRELAGLLTRYGARADVIVPGFGMTETCAGAVYNVNCPYIDVQSRKSTVSVGKCMSGIDVRVSVPDGTRAAACSAQNEPGSLEVRGEVVFRGYYNNDEATSDCLTADGWFRTGDTAYIDVDGNLHLAGRESEIVNIRGVKVDCTYVSALLQSAVRGAVQNLVVFPIRPEGHHTEQLAVAFVLAEGDDGGVLIRDRIIRTCVEITYSSPVVIPLMDASQLPISSLGKVSRARMAQLFHAGVFKAAMGHFEKSVTARTSTKNRFTYSPTESWLLGQLASILRIETASVHLDANMFDLGFTSLSLIQMKHSIDCRTEADMPIADIIEHPTARSLAKLVGRLHSCRLAAPAPDSSIVSYDPVVTLHSGGKKTPLWLIHPGTGGILIFIHLVSHLKDQDRPIYALRARGFDAGQQPFASVDEAVQTYLGAVLKRQPVGPYAIAGYSYGSMLAFELAKRLEKVSRVSFLGCMNLPPHIKLRMRQLTWNSCLVHLALFLGLVGKSEAEELEGVCQSASRHATKLHVRKAASSDRMAELRLAESGLYSWTDVAYRLQSMAVDYEPSGAVSTMDIFYAAPLRCVAMDMADWRENHLGRWRDFCNSPPSFWHIVGATHYEMLGLEHVEASARAIGSALSARDA